MFRKGLLLATGLLSACAAAPPERTPAAPPASTGSPAAGGAARAASAAPVASVPAPAPVASLEGARCAEACARGEACLDGACVPVRARLAAGSRHACALSTGGDLSCWGDNENAQLADGTRDARASAVRAAAPPGTVQVAAGEDFTCALDGAGLVRCWGAETSLHAGEQLPDAERATILREACARGSRNACSAQKASERVERLVKAAKAVVRARGGAVPLPAAPPSPRPAAGAPIPSLKDVEEIAAGGSEVCARTRAGTVACFTLAAESHRTHPTIAMRPSYWKPAAVPSISDAVRVGVGRSLGCALRRSGAVACWRPDDAAAPVSGVEDAVDLAVGGDHACALRRSGAVACWGQNYFGQLGGRPEAAGQVIEVAGLTGVAGLAAAQDSTCARLLDGRVACWGAVADPRGQGSITPVEVPGVAKSVAVAVGDRFGCAALAGGEVRCWGDPARGRVGGGAMPETLAPRDMPGIDDAVSVATGQLATCALRRSGAVACWGDGYTSGAGAAAGPASFVEVAGIADAAGVWMRSNSVCALRKGGGVACWYGREAPEAAFAGLDVVAVAPSATQRCAALKDGSVWCDAPGWKAEAVPGIGGLASVEIGAADWTCGRLKAGGALCWRGLHLPGAPPDAPARVPVKGVGDAASVSTNGIETCIARRSGKVDCFHTLDAPAVPVPTPGLADAVRVAMSASEVFWCALRKAGTVACHGRSNFWGERGDGPLGRRGPYPTDVAGLSGVVAMDTGHDHVCAVKSDGKVACWGNDSAGQVSGRAHGFVQSAVTVAGLPAGGP